MSDILDIANSLMNTYKTNYLDLMASPVNKKAPLLSMIKLDTSVVGNVQSHGAAFSDVGGFSSGEIGDASGDTVKQTNYSVKKQYFKAQIDCLSLELARDKKGAFTELMNRAMVGGKDTRDPNYERMLVQGDGTGALGTIDSGGVTDNGGGVYSIVISAATFVRNNFRKQDLLNVSTGTSPFRVESVDRSTRTVVITRLSGSDVPVATNVLYRQKSKDAEMMGFKGVLTATSGSLYGITVGDGWQSQHYDAASAPISEGMILEMLYNINDEVGEMPDAMIVGHTQRKKLAELARNKVLTVENLPVKSETGVVIGNFPTILIEGKEVKIIVSQDMLPSSAFFVNLSKVSLRTAGKGDFVKGADGILHPEHAYLGKDRYSIIWKQYGEIFMHPAYHGEIHNLGTTVTVA